MKGHSDEGILRARVSVHPVHRNPGTGLLRPFKLKTLTSLNKEVRPFFLGDNSIWSFPSASSLGDYSIWRS